MDRKGQALEALQNIVIPLIAIGLILVIGMLIYSEVETQVVARSTENGTKHINNTVSPTNNTWIPMTYSGNCMQVNCHEVNNNSAGGGFISSASYSCGPRGIRVIDEASDSLHTSINVTYTCIHRSYAYNATGTVTNATQDIPGWLGIIVITVIGGILLGLIAFFRRR